MTKPTPADAVCYFCDRPATKSLLVWPEPKEKRSTQFGALGWLQSFCNEHWKAIVKSHIVDLTKPVERRDLLVKVVRGKKR